MMLTHPLTNRDIVCLSFVAWDDVWGTPQQVMSRLAPDNRVLFIEPPVSPLSLVTGVRDRGYVLQRVERWRAGVRQVAPNVWAAAPPPLLPLRYHPLVSRLNANALRGWLRHTCERLGMYQPLVWNFQPAFAGVGSAVNPALSIYHCVDDFSAVPHWWNPAHQVQAADAACSREADLVVCTGRRLAEERAAVNPNSHFVPNGADTALFGGALQPGAAPAELATLPHPIIGFGGVIDFRFDAALVRQMAARRPEWSFVLVGPVKGGVDLAPLQALPNVHLTGPQPMAAMPAYLRAMDVCTIPYVTNEFNRHAFPLKLFEYLAAGKPVVATPLAELQPYAGDLLTLAPDAAAFEQAVAAALAEDTPARADRRVRLAADNSWERRVDDLGWLVHRALSRPPTPTRPGATAVPTITEPQRG